MGRLAIALLAAFPALAARADAPSVPELLEQLRDEDPEVRIAAREALRDAGGLAKPELTRLAAAGDGAANRGAKSLLLQIEFDDRVKSALAGGDSWYRWERSGKAKAWVRLSAKAKSGADRGYTLTETLYMDEVTLTQVAETDRDLVVSSVRCTLASGGDKFETSATFADGMCAFEADGEKHEMTAPGVPLTDWAIVRFAPAFVANPLKAPEIVVWDSTDSEPATTNLRIGEEVVVDGPGGSVRAVPVKVEGLMIAYVTADGKVSHATHGEGSVVVPVKPEDVPEGLRKK